MSAQTMQHRDQRENEQDRAENAEQNPENRRSIYSLGKRGRPLHLGEPRVISKMQMAYQPDNEEAERDNQDQKDNSAFAPLLAERSAPSAELAILAPAIVMKGNRDIQPAPAFAGPLQ